MTSATLALAGLALVLFARRPASADEPSATGGRRALRRPGLSRQTAARLASGALGIVVALLVGGALGAAAGLGSAIGTARFLRRLEPAAVRQHRVSRQTELPVTLDLLSVCLRAGMPLVAALETVATALSGPFSDDLRLVAGLQRLGAGPATAWAELADDHDLAPVVRAVARSAENGSRLAASFDRLAADRRSALAAAGLARARTAGVVAMAPLGLCFLPAFVCLGIVPIVLSLAEEVLP